MAKKQAAEDEVKPVSADEAAKQDDAGEGSAKPAPKKRAPKAKAEESAAPAESAAPSPKPVVATEAKKKKKKPGIPPARGKKLRNQLKNQINKIEREGASPLKKAVATLKSLRKAKFDETVEIHMSLGVDTQQADQLVRGTVPLPHGIGKTVRVVVFCQGENIAKAKEAGADFAGADDLLEKITKQNWLDFDVALATQDMMGKVSRLGKLLGPRGLMPTPKAGTVVTGDIAAAVKDFKAGKVEYRTDKSGNVHAGVGKISFDEEKLTANITAFVDAIRGAKPSGVKGNYIKSITICSTMSPGVPVSIS